MMVGRTSLLAAGVAASMTWPCCGAALADPPVIQTLNFHCHVAAGPALTGCTLNGTTDLDPVKVRNLGLREQKMPSCMLRGATPGVDVDVPVRFIDSPNLLRPPAPGPLHIVVNPDIASRPSPELVESLYPPTAKKAGVTGRAVIECVVMVDGSAQQCAIKSEDPPGYGFGDAAVRIVAGIRFIPQTRDCVPVSGGRVSVPIAFALESGPTPAR